MKLPDVNSKNKIRDSQICTRFMNGEHPLDLASHFKLAISTIYRIIYRNRDKINLDRQHERNMRVAHLRRLCNSHPNALAKKSTLDIIEAQRKELEGDKSTTNVGVTVVVMPTITCTDGTLKEYKIGNRIAPENP